MMLFKNNAGSTLASFLFLAATGNLKSFFLDSSASSLLYVSAEEMVCTGSLDFDTWEDKKIPTKDIPVPNTYVLKYGIPAVLAERFDMNTGEGNWVQSFEFESFKKESDDSSDFAANLSIVDATSSSELDNEPVPREISRSLRGETETLGRGLPLSCYYNWRCRNHFMNKKKEYYQGHLRIKRMIMCRLCEVDDDMLDSNMEDLESYFGAEKRTLTLDQLMGKVSLEDHENRPAHEEFERDVCDELAVLKGYPSFETIKNCKVRFDCRPATEDERKLTEDSTIVIADRRDDAQTEATNDPLYMVTSTVVAAANGAN
eukprot:jgi/Psemu1/55050/gm1.55050_g